MEEGLQGLLMGAVLVMFLIAVKRWNRRWKSG